MKRQIIIITTLIVTTLACKNSNSNTGVPVPTNPLSKKDPKVGLSPEERYGALFDSVQASKIFTDSKTFLDYIPITTTDSLMAAFNEAAARPDFSLQRFVNQYFMPPKSLFNGFVSNTSLSPETHLENLLAAQYRTADTADFGTKIPMPKPYYVGTGSAQDFNYWESYFMMLGLQAVGKTDAMQDIVDNFAHLINSVGYVPSGNRTYYLSRSQPPFFACMVQLLAAEKGKDVLVKYVDVLEKEYNFWLKDAQTDEPNNLTTNKRVAQFDRNTLNRYRDDKDTPRPEAFQADKDTAKNSNRTASDTYRHLRSAAESGWTFSSRWLDNPMKLGTIHTCDIIPVDLNALLYNLEWTISRAKAAQKKIEEATEWEKKASHRREAMMRYCWNMSKGMFFDFDFNRYKQTEVVSAATVYPLVFRMVTKKDADKVAAAIRSQLLKAGGIVTTTNKTGQDWDAPNGFAPLQWMAIQGLRNYGHDELANDIKNRWIALNVKVYKETGKMLEKYNVEDLSLTSGGGNYSAQDGFGWTNGVLLKLLTEK